MGKNDKKAKREISHLVLRQAMSRRLPRRVAGSGQLVFPAVPALADHYADVMHKTFAALGRVFDRDETKQIRATVKKLADEGFARSPYSRLVVNYQTDEPPATSLTYKVTIEHSSVEDEYERWSKTRTPPLFGSHPDAKIMDVARSLGPPPEVNVLDVGAGTGRNSLPLAREGFNVDAIELAPALLEVLSRDAKAEGLPVHVIEGDAVADRIELKANHYQLIFLSEVIASHIRDVPSCRSIFEDAAVALAPGGLLVFNAFIATQSYFPDDLARELSQVFWCVAFTHKDMKTAMEGLPFEFVSDEAVHEYEHDHLPTESWPPTGWFESWAQGLDLYDLTADKSPLELRWLVYRKTV